MLNLARQIAYREARRGKTPRWLGYYLTVVAQELEEAAPPGVEERLGRLIAGVGRGGGRGQPANETQCEEEVDTEAILSRIADVRRRLADGTVKEDQGSA